MVALICSGTMSATLPRTLEACHDVNNRDPETPVIRRHGNRGQCRYLQDFPQLRIGLIPALSANTRNLLAPDFGIASSDVDHALTTVAFVDHKCRFVIHKTA